MGVEYNIRTEIIYQEPSYNDDYLEENDAFWEATGVWGNYYENGLVAFDDDYFMVNTNEYPIDITIDSDSEYELHIQIYDSGENFVQEYIKYQYDGPISFEVDLQGHSSFYIVVVGTGENVWYDISITYPGSGGTTTSNNGSTGSDNNTGGDSLPQNPLQVDGYPLWATFALAALPLAVIIRKYGRSYRR